MLITKQSPLSGVWNEMELPVTEEQLAAHQSGVLAQEAFPHLNSEEREFIISGITPTEWENMFGNI